MIPLRNLRRVFCKTIRQPGYAFRVFKKRSSIYFYYRLGRGRSSYPEAITLFLTHMCNLHCKMCGQWGESGITKKRSAQHIKEQLSFTELKDIIDDVSRFKPNITLFGGEPLLHPHCIEVMKYIKEKKMHCLMITNGSLLDDVADRIVNAGLDELNVSLDGDGELHDEIRGMPGLFERIMKGLKRVDHIRKEKGKRRPFINLQCTITQYNYRHLEQLIDVANEAQADSLTFHNLIFLGKDIIKRQKEFDRLLDCSSLDWEGFIFEPGIEPEVLYEKIKEIMGGRYRFAVDFYPSFSLKGLKEYYRNPSYFPSEYAARCLSPWMVAYIFPDGQVRPCLNFDYSYGDVRKSKFSKLWNNDRAITFRRTLLENRIFPVCVRCTELYRY